ncbi:TPA: hypothetical protein UOJ01_001268 [Stenotrophomonas maltophilia]|nr:hypothetical protein [Stenotrophomonas maltophilia]
MALRLFRYQPSLLAAALLAPLAATAAGVLFRGEIYQGGTARYLAGRPRKKADNGGLI